MRLHELVLLRNELEKAIDLDAVNRAVEENYRRLTDLSKNNLFSEEILQLANNHKQAKQSFDSNIQELEGILLQINQLLIEKTDKFFHENYQTELQYDSADSIREVRKLHLAEGADTELLNRINLYSGWKYPALEIGCRDGEFTKYLVASDPLYISDIYEEFLESTAGQFTSQYQARLRKYKIVDNQINNLPINQFSFIFSFNYFNYLSLDSIKMYLKQAMEILRPGGTMLFTYNNADMPAAAGLAESYFMTYVPRSMLVPLVESMGFAIVEARDYYPSTSWLEIQKPGKLQTVKAHQALGEIKYY
jgi:SAM-dependent methyltransferase